MIKKNTMLKKTLVFALCASMVVGSSVSLVSGTEAQAAKKAFVKSVKVAKKVTLKKGEKKSVKVKVKAKGKANTKFSVKVKNKKIVNVKAKKSAIVFKGKKVGSTKVVLTTKGTNSKKKKIKKTIKVVVKKANDAQNSDNGQGSTGIVPTPNSGNQSGTYTPQPTLKVPESIKVSTQSELESALKMGVKEITLDVKAGEGVTIPSGNYTGSKLIVTGENGSVTNYGKFDDVVLAAEVEYNEKNKNNINVQAPAKVNVAETSTVSVTVNLPQSDSDKTITINNEGVVTKLDVASGVKVRVKGNGSQSTVMNVNISGEGAAVVTNQESNVNVTAKDVSVTFTGETEKTKVAIADSSCMPKIMGNGFIEVTNSETGQKEVVTAATSEEADRVNLQGVVVADEVPNGLEGVNVQLISATDYKGNDTDSAKVTEVKTDKDGGYTFNEVPSGNYYLVMKKEGYKDAIQILAVVSKFNNVYQNEEMCMLPSDVTDNKKASIGGRVLNAADKYSISGITVELRANKGNVIGKTVALTKTDENGEFIFNESNVEGGIESNQYTVRAVDNRGFDDAFISNSINVCVRADEEVIQDITMSQPVVGDGIRFVLTWGDESKGAPKDLDAHLFGPAMKDSGYKYHEVYFGESEYGDEFVTYSSLDVDETEYKGPETITINEALDGVYYYCVYNYSNEPGIENSGARVDVYVGNELVTSYNVPTSGGDKDKYWWKVCSYDSRTGEINSFNQITEKIEVDGEVLAGEGAANESIAYGKRDAIEWKMLENDCSGFYYDINEEGNVIKHSYYFEYEKIPAIEEIKKDIKDIENYGYNVTIDESGINEEGLKITIPVVVKKGVYTLDVDIIVESRYVVGVSGDNVAYHSCGEGYIDLYGADEWTNENIAAINYELQDGYTSKVIADEESGVNKLQVYEGSAVVATYDIYTYSGYYFKGIGGEYINSYSDYDSEIIFYSVNMFDGIYKEPINFEMVDGYTCSGVYKKDDEYYIDILKGGSLVKTKKIRFEEN